MRLCTALLLAVAACAVPSLAPAQKQGAGGAVTCPAGQAIHAVDFQKRTLICVPASASPSGALQLLDSDGQVVGVLLGTNTAARQFAGEWYSFQVLRSGFQIKGVTLYYQSNDCTGTAYIASAGASLPRPAQFAGGGGFATFYTETHGTHATLNLRSAHEVTATEIGECLRTPNTLEVALPTLTTVITTPPFRIAD